MMSALPAAVATIGPKPALDSRTAILGYAANELAFAVVGHVGSGTSTVASALKKLLEASGLSGGSYDVEILKARSVIESWATANGRAVPQPGNGDVEVVESFQDLGDEMRSSGDYAAVAKGLIGGIRRTRAAKTGIGDPGDAPVKPDGKKRAYILDSIRHPAEVELLRHVYQDAFFLIGVVCE